MAGGPPLRLIVPALLATVALIHAFVLFPGLSAAGVAGLLTATSAVTAVVMARAALSGRAAGPRARALALAGGLGLTAMAGAASGIAAEVAPGVLVDGVPLPAEIPLVSLFFVAALHLPAILRPPQHRSGLAQLRTALDVLGVWACLLFSAWLLLFSNGGEQRGATITALVFGGGAATTAGVAGVHAIRHRTALQWCGPAAALSLLGLTALVIGLDYPHVPNAAIAAVVAAVAINVAGGLLWYGSVRLCPDLAPLPSPGSEPSASFPLLTVPILGSALITVYHLLNGGDVDAPAIMLGALGVAAVAAREFVSAVALRRQAGHLTDQGNRLRSLMFGAADVAMVLDANLAVRWQSPAAFRQFELPLGRSVALLVDPGQVDDVHATLTARLADPGAATDLGPASGSSPAPGSSPTSGPGSSPTSTSGPGSSPTSTSGPGPSPTSGPGSTSGSGSGSGGAFGSVGVLAVRLRDGFGRWRETEWTISGADPAEPGRTLVVHIRDVSQARDLEQALRQQTHLDRHTGLANGEGLLRAAELIPDAAAMIVIELGGLTAVGDVHGRELAESVLVEAARRLRGGVTAADVPARVGESRLAVLTHCGAVRAQLLAGQLVNALSAPYTAAGAVAHLSAWAGLADMAAGEPAAEVLRRSQLALRSVRSGPPGAVEWYEPEMETRLLRRSTLEQDLPGAVIDLDFQVVVDLPGRRPAGVEVLPVWRHPVLGPVPAGELLALAEELGALSRISDHVLRTSCRLLAGWRRLHPGLWLAVDVRPRQLADPAFQASLHTALETHGLPPAALVVEVSEDDVRQPGVDEVAASLGRLRAEGVRTAVGDFGTGPTSLSRLRILPVDLLKIDQEVFDEPAVLEVAVTVGHRLGMEVIAHGVADLAELNIAETAGCRLAQGGLLGRPMPAERLEAFLEQHHDARQP
ncbi:bifunctional diguanylate cyclase/phosphodiesterase [Paractinoplanes atraurantiacus]|uniref:Diguanylate cyclase, GGDEF domain n=1 Tax=Paractinoplanes atraurantiacus TaxID=1036182 RepID=A0A285IJZ9_9ACTN|nr:bifunctional diguanylate cyclase/phosphodiesterase [Actinoplanes atraurantiacus]SNY47406.1 Diguanylate cyclase, GGDEF domain [Actinoplanes atraurantiacus]